MLESIQEKEIRDEDVSMTSSATEELGPTAATTPLGTGPIEELWDGSIARDEDKFFTPEIGNGPSDGSEGPSTGTNGTNGASCGSNGTNGTSSGSRLELGDVDFKGLGRTNMEFLVNSLTVKTDSIDDVTTYYIMKHHICKILLLIVYLVISKVDILYGVFTQIQELKMIILNLMTLHLLFNYEYVTGRAVALARLKLNYYSSLDSIPLLVNLCPDRDFLPRSLAFVVKLDGSGDMAHVFNGNLLVLNQISLVIIWSCVLNLEYINIYEKSGIYWYNPTSLYVLKQVVIQSFKYHLGGDTGRIRVPSIKLVELNSSTEVVISPADMGEDPSLNGDDSSNWHDVDSDDSSINSNQLVVYLLNHNQNNPNLASSSELILLPSSKTVNLQGYYTQNEYNSPVVYHSESPFNLSYFVTGLHYYKSYCHETDYGQDQE